MASLLCRLKILNNALKQTGDLRSAKNVTGLIRARVLPADALWNSVLPLRPAAVLMTNGKAL